MATRGRSLPSRRGRAESGRPVVVALAVVFVGLAAYDLISGGVSSAGRPSASHPVAQAAPRTTAAALAGSASPARSPSITASPAASPSSAASSAPGEAAHSLEVATAAAYGPDGASDGDHPELAPGIINGGDGQPWYTSWYATPEFGNLQPGTGLLLDMGDTVTVSSLRLVLGAPVGADVQVRVGDTPLLAELPVAASASDVGGTVQLPADHPGQRPVRADLVHSAAARPAGQIPGQRLQRRRIWHQEDIIRRARHKSSEQSRCDP